LSIERDFAKHYPGFMRKRQHKKIISLSLAGRSKQLRFSGGWLNASFSREDAEGTSVPAIQESCPSVNLPNKPLREDAFGFFRSTTAVILFLFVALFSACKPDGANDNSTTTTVANPDNLALLSHRYLVQDQQLYGTFRVRANKGIDVYLNQGVDIIANAQKGPLRGDAVILEDLYQAHLLKKTGALSPYNAATFGDYVPSRYVDNEGYWAALTRWTMSFVYRPEKVDLEQMRVYGSLLNPRYQGRISMAHPDSSGLISMVAGMIAAHGEEPARIYLETLKTNLSGPPRGNDWDAISDVLRGDADIALVNGSQFMRYRHSGNAEMFKAMEGLEVEVPVDTDGNNYYNITPISILNNAPFRNYAISLVEFLTIEENQGMFSEAALEFPVNVFAPSAELLNNTFNLPQGKISMEMTENQLDKAAELVHRIFP
jgi:iron(III) transport system substrate-binding protein